MKTLVKIVRLIDGFELWHVAQGTGFKFEIETHHRNGLVTVHYK